MAQGASDPLAALETAEAVTERAESVGDPSGAMLGRALALFLRNVLGEPDTIDELIALCRAALPFEEERGDPRRLAFLWDLLDGAAGFRMQHAASLEASLQALRYWRLAGYSRSETSVRMSALIGGPTPADEATRMMDELAAWRPPGSRAFPRAALLAMLGRFDEAWPLAEARVNHLREVTGNTSQDVWRFLSLIAEIEGDRERTCRYLAEEIEVTTPAPGVTAGAKARLARQLCYLAASTRLSDSSKRLGASLRAVVPAFGRMPLPPRRSC